MTLNNSKILATFILSASFILSVTTAMAGQNTKRVNPHKKATSLNFSDKQRTSQRKWCGPGGRLCIENGRWTWKKKKRK